MVTTATSVMQPLIERVLYADGWVEYRRGVDKSRAQPYETFQLMDAQGEVVETLIRREVELAIARSTVVAPVFGLPAAGLHVQPLILRMGPHQEESLQRVHTFIPTKFAFAHVGLTANSPGRTLEPKDYK